MITITFQFELVKIKIKYKVNLRYYDYISIMQDNQQSESPTFKIPSEGNISTPTLIKQSIVVYNKSVERCRIGKYQYLTSDFLGEGFSSNVYKCTLINNKKQRFAIKVIDLTKFKLDQRQLLETEIEIISALNHPNIIRCVDTYKTNENYFLITEYCPHGDLNQLIRLQNYITEDKAIPIMRQILDGYKYLMTKNIIHRDLKPANIMRFGSQWKIGDFGFSKYCKQQYLIEKLYVGTPFYMPPQSLQLNKYSYRSDIFALGIILFEMLTGQTPWPSKDEKQLIDSMRQNGLVIPPIIVSKQIKQFLMKSIVLDYYQRMSKDQFKKFTLQNIDVQKVARTRPGRGLSPTVKRQLSKSGKKSFLFATPLKSKKNDYFMLSTSKNIQLNVKSSQNMPLRSFDYSKPHIQQQLVELEGSPVSVKMFKQNSDIINNEVELAKIMNHVAINDSLLGLNEQDSVFLSLLMHLLGLKILKMISNKRQNYYKLGKWDMFRQSDKYKCYISQILNLMTKFEASFKEYLKNVNIKQYQKFQEQFPELIENTSINFKIYGKIFERLRHFIRQSIIFNQKSIKETDITKKCFIIKQIYEIMSTIRNRTRRQQEIMGYGLRIKPTSISLRDANWSKQALLVSLKQLELLCKHKIQHS